MMARHHIQTYSIFPYVVGSFLAELHILQRENREMEFRIMDLTSQKEFYLSMMNNKEG